MSISTNNKKILNAVFDNSMIKTPIQILKNDPLKFSKLLFLEDHCILAQTKSFQYHPLFDPSICYRREFFDLAWNIYVRGGDVGMAINSVVVYQRIQPVTIDDIAYFINRRQDSFCFASQRYLNEKWNIEYRYDQWHEKQRFDSILNLNLDKQLIDRSAMYEEYLPIRLILCFFTAIGANKFKFDHENDDETDIKVGLSFDKFYNHISTNEFLKYPFKKSISLQFLQEINPIKFSINQHSKILADRLKYILEPETLNLDEISTFKPFISHPFSGYCLFRLTTFTSTSSLSMKVSTANRNNNILSAVNESQEENNFHYWDEILNIAGINEYEDIRSLPSLIVDYINPVTKCCCCSSTEFWIWIQYKHEVPTEINSMETILSCPFYNTIYTTMKDIASCLKLNLIPSTPAEGTHNWQNFDLIRQISNENTNEKNYFLFNLHKLSFNPVTIEKIVEIGSWLKNNLLEEK